MISQITPAGIRPASRARSTAASVWPARSSTPPSLAFSGKTWPGWTRSLGRRVRVHRHLDRVRAVVRPRSRSSLPRRASTETVKAVSNGDSFLAAIRSRPSSSQRSAVSERQISPRPWVAMKLIASGVANCAAIVRSPSFSRFSSSQTTTIRPRRISSIASSIGRERCSLAAARAPALSSSGFCRSRALWRGLTASSGSFFTAALHEPLGVAGDQVHLEVHGVPSARPPSVVRSSVSGINATSNRRRRGPRP